METARMKKLTSAEIAGLADALLATPNAFYARRMLQRLEREEVSVGRAIFLLHYPVTAGPSHRRTDGAYPKGVVPFPAPHAALGAVNDLAPAHDGCVERG
jgi:hypothetical protein